MFFVTDDLRNKRVFRISKNAACLSSQAFNCRKQVEYLSIVNLKDIVILRSSPVPFVKRYLTSHSRTLLYLVGVLYAQCIHRN
jgi:hypothetical protein